jgi:formate hydrogenlyase subunit 4
MTASIIAPLGFMFFSFAAAPALCGLISRIKALFAGRQGQPLLQLYFDLFRLLGKRSLYSKSTSPLFYMAPLVNFALFLCALSMLPMPGYDAMISFQGDLILFAYLFALARFLSILAALDTASSFEGMGASREAYFSLFSEIALFLSLAALARFSGSLSLAEILRYHLPGIHDVHSPALAMLVISLFMVLLAENYRIPVDDPTTHLELTMIHEVMVLDHSGPELAFILYSASLKLWIMSVFIALVIISAVPMPYWIQPLVALGLVLLIGITIGVLESTMARLRMVRVPRMLLSACVLGLLSFIILG